MSFDITTHESPISANLELLGPIVRLQVQTAHLKQGEKPHRWYDPAPIQSVPALRLDAGGVTGLDNGEIADVHHLAHPISRFRGDNGVSVGLTGHYQHMREQFGPHLVDGIAGENVLIASQRVLTDHDVGQGVAIRTSTGLVLLTAVLGAPPCVEFSRFAAGYTREQKSDRTITETLRFLSDGVRGFYATLAPTTPVADISLGDEVYLVRS